MNLSELSKPFPESDIEWRIGRSGKSGEKIWAMCFAYVTNRAIMDRLDAVCGPENWKNEFEPWTVGTDHGVRCGISILIPTENVNGQKLVAPEWVTKYDGANPTAMEPIKGGFSDSMKRAAVQWGIGRYLYNLEEGFATVSMTKIKGGRYAQTKDKTTFYWAPPPLPKWAKEEIITGDKGENVVSIQTIMEYLTAALDKDKVDGVWESAMKYTWTDEDKKTLEECKENVLTKLRKSIDDLEPPFPPN